MSRLVLSQNAEKNNALRPARSSRRIAQPSASPTPAPSSPSDSGRAVPLGHNIWTEPSFSAFFGSTELCDIEIHEPLHARNLREPDGAFDENGEYTSKDSYTDEELHQLVNEIQRMHQPVTGTDTGPWLRTGYVFDTRTLSHVDNDEFECAQRVLAANHLLLQAGLLAPLATSEISGVVAPTPRRFGPTDQTMRWRMAHQSLPQSSGLLALDQSLTPETRRARGQLIPIPAAPVTWEQVGLAHSAEFVASLQLLETLPSQDLTLIGDRLDSVTYGPSTLEAALVSAGGVVALLDAISEGTIDNGVAIVRPPGHHAEHTHSKGFCIINNVVLAAQVALMQYPHLYKRVLILDWDVHHGNGTQRAFESDPRVLYISLHRHDHGHFYPHSAAADYDFVGLGHGAGRNINVAWNHDSILDADYVYAFQHLVTPVAREYAPDLVIISAGFDAARGDPLGGPVAALSYEAYAFMTAELRSVAPHQRVILALEGGYNPRSLAMSALVCVSNMLGPGGYQHRLDIGQSLRQAHPEAVKAVIRSRYIHSRFWDVLKEPLPSEPDGECMDVESATALTLRLAAEAFAREVPAPQEHWLSTAALDAMYANLLAEYGLYCLSGGTLSRLSSPSKRSQLVAFHRGLSEQEDLALARQLGLFFPAYPSPVSKLINQWCHPSNRKLPRGFSHIFVVVSASVLGHAPAVRDAYARLSAASLIPSVLLTCVTRANSEDLVSMVDQLSAQASHDHMQATLANLPPGHVVQGLRGRGVAASELARSGRVLGSTPSPTMVIPDVKPATSGQSTKANDTMASEPGVKEPPATEPTSPTDGRPRSAQPVEEKLPTQPGPCAAFAVHVLLDAEGDCVDLGKLARRAVAAALEDLSCFESPRGADVVLVIDDVSAGLIANKTGTTPVSFLFDNAERIESALVAISSFSISIADARQTSQEGLGLPAETPLLYLPCTMPASQFQPRRPSSGTSTDEHATPQHDAPTVATSPAESPSPTTSPSLGSLPQHYPEFETTCVFNATSEMLLRNFDIVWGFVSSTKRSEHN
ncbi:hypothetical protein H696_02785 [Fonticula alba]|uniref:histone deacetylase n=1 Tax=Fonticula alba TaxID=691883 RepID=A0A058ZA76_FONAL|nr:hypothetical protein H696_02785 [Fonticula alba]KCV70442.1 hypothetical protein H696_02785 [Fonticula alba]|eukprot:XP_009494958.1 hypothetical protein H696_02785 [Fonticula alba]